MTRSDLPEWVRALRLRDLALASLTVRPSEPLAVIDAAAAGGFGSVGLKFTPRPGESEVALSNDPAWQEQVRHGLAGNGIELFSVGSLWLDGNRDPAMFRAAIEVGVTLGARRAIGISIDPEPSRKTDQIGMLASLCGEYDMELALEFFAYSTISSLGDALTIIEAVGANNMTVVVDALHFFRSGGTSDQLAALPRERLGWFQLCDAPDHHPGMDGLSFEGGKDRHDPGEGGLPLNAYLTALPAGTPIEIEIPRLESIDLGPRERGIEVAAHVYHFLQGSRTNDKGAVNEH